MTIADWKNHKRSQGFMTEQEIEECGSKLQNLPVGQSLTIGCPQDCVVATTEGLEKSPR